LPQPGEPPTPRSKAQRRRSTDAPAAPANSSRQRTRGRVVAADIRVTWIALTCGRTRRAANVSRSRGPRTGVVKATWAGSPALSVRARNVPTRRPWAPTSNSADPSGASPSSTIETTTA
jgi:hypothetical protein